MSIADFAAHEHGVRFSRTGGPDAPDAPSSTSLAAAAALASEVRLIFPVHAVFPLKNGAEAHELSASGHARGNKIIMTVP